MTYSTNKIWPVIMGGNHVRPVYIAQPLNGGISSSDFLTGMIKASLSLEVGSERLFDICRFQFAGHDSLLRLYLAARKVFKYQEDATLLLLREAALPEPPSLELAEAILASQDIVEAGRIGVFCSVQQPKLVSQRLSYNLFAKKWGQNGLSSNMSDSGYVAVRADFLIQEIEICFPALKTVTNDRLTEQELSGLGVNSKTISEFLGQTESIEPLPIFSSRNFSNSGRLLQGVLETNVASLSDYRFASWGEQTVICYSGQRGKLLMTKLKAGKELPTAFIGRKKGVVRSLLGAVTCTTKQDEFILLAGEKLSFTGAAVQSIRNETNYDVVFTQEVKSNDFPPRVKHTVYQGLNLILKRRPS